MKRMRRQPEQGAEQQREKRERARFPLIHILSCLFAVFMLYSFNSNYTKKTVEYKAKLVQEQQINKEIASLEKENKDLSEQVSHLKTNEGVEEVAREKLGLIKPNEIAFVVVSTPTPQAAEPSPQDTKQPDNRNMKNIELKKEIQKESAREEGWFKKILNFMGRK